MPVGFPAKTDFAAGAVLTAAQMNDITGTLNLVNGAQGFIAGKNALLNGAFDIWQRGTSIANTSGSIYGPDRWSTWRGGFATGATTSRQTAGLTGFQYCARVQRDSGNASTAGISFGQGLESSTSIPFAGRTITLSFYARRGANYSGASNNLAVDIYSGTGTDQAMWNGFTGLAAVGTTTAALTTTWTRYTLTGTVGATATQLGVIFAYNPTGTAGAADFFEITGVQLEIGSNASTFSRAAATIAGELSACQRYYVRFGQSATFNQYGYGWVYSTTQATIGVPLPVAMRTAPSSIDFSAIRIDDANGGTYAITGLALDTGISHTMLGGATATFTGGTAGRFATIRNNNNSAGYVAFNAEL